MNVLNNFIKKINFTKEETIIILKRLNRVLPDPVYSEEGNLNYNDLLMPLEILPLLEKKYSLLTTINTIQFIIKLLEYYGTESQVINMYNDCLNDLLSVKEYPDLYIKKSITELELFVKQKYLEYLVECSHTKVRNLILLSLLMNYPLRLNSLISLNYISYEGANEDDAPMNAVSIINNNGDYSLILNELSIVKRKIFKITDELFIKILKLYTSRFKRGTYLICSVVGKPISKSNLCNGLINYTRKELGTPLSVFDLKTIWKNEKREDPNSKELMDLFFT